MTATQRKLTRADYDSAKVKAEEIRTSLPNCTSWSGRLYLVGQEWKQFFLLAACEVKNVRAIYYHPDGGMDMATDYMRRLIARDVAQRDEN